MVEKRRAVRCKCGGIGDGRRKKRQIVKLETPGTRDDIAPLGMSSMHVLYDVPCTEVTAVAVYILSRASLERG